MPVMFFDDAENDRQAQSGSFAYIFGGKERIIYFLFYFIRHAYAGICYFYRDVFGIIRCFN